MNAPHFAAYTEFMNNKFDSSVADVLATDPRHLVFTLARYKFVAKMLYGYGSVLEIGCGNGFGKAIVEQAVSTLESTDIDTIDITQDFREGYDAVFCLDVIEHIAPDMHDAALFNLSSCAPVCIIGTPSLESQPYASKLSKEKHIGCRSGERWRDCLRGHWKNVFMFGMNDEVVHTGFLPMSHYILALCVE